MEALEREFGPLQRQFRNYDHDQDGWIEGTDAVKLFQPYDFAQPNMHALWNKHSESGKLSYHGYMNTMVDIYHIKQSTVGLLSQPRNLNAGGSSFNSRPSSASSMGSTSQGAITDPPLPDMTQADRQKYQNFFYSISQGQSVVNRNAALSIYSKSQQPPEFLNQMISVISKNPNEITLPQFMKGCQILKHRQLNPSLRLLGTPSTASTSSHGENNKHMAIKMKAETESINRQITQSQQQSLKNRSEENSLDARLKEVERQRNLAKEKLDDIQRELNAFQEKKVSLQRAIQEAQSNTRQYESTQSTYQRQMQSMNQELNRINHLVEQSKTQEQKAKAEHDAVRAQLMTQKDTLENLYASLKENNSDAASTALQQVQQEFDQVSNDIQEKYNELATAQMDQTRLQAQEVSLKQKIRLLQSELAQVSTQVDSYKQSHRELENQVNTLSKQVPTSDVEKSQQNVMEANNLIQQAATMLKEAASLLSTTSSTIGTVQQNMPSVDDASNNDAFDNQPVDDHGFGDDGFGDSWDAPPPSKQKDDNQSKPPPAIIETKDSFGNDDGFDGFDNEPQEKKMAPRQPPPPPKRNSTASSPNFGDDFGDNFGNETASIHSEPAASASNPLDFDSYPQPSKTPPPSKDIFGDLDDMLGFTAKPKSETSSRSSHNFNLDAMFGDSKPKEEDPPAKKNDDFFDTPDW